MTAVGTAVVTRAPHAVVTLETAVTPVIVAVVIIAAAIVARRSVVRIVVRLAVTVAAALRSKGVRV